MQSILAERRRWPPQPRWACIASGSYSQLDRFRRRGSSNQQAPFDSVKLLMLAQKQALAGMSDVRAYGGMTVYWQDQALSAPQPVGMAVHKSEMWTIHQDSFGGRVHSLE